MSFVRHDNSEHFPPLLVCPSPQSSVDGVNIIEEFIQEALELYRKQQATRIDISRYLYIPVLSGFAARAATAEEGAGASSVLYKRYKLSEEKTFASFFHPDKDPILSLVNQFQDKKGKFGIPGYPQKVRGLPKCIMS
jgi:chaperone BCS1